MLCTLESHRRRRLPSLIIATKTVGEYFIRFMLVHSLTKTLISPACLLAFIMMKPSKKKWFFVFPFRRWKAAKAERERERVRATALVSARSTCADNIFHSKIFVYVSLHAFRALRVLVVAMSAPKNFPLFLPEALSSQRKIDSDGMKNLRSRCR